ncbi:MAG: protein translocase subunit SecD [Desulfobulbaceae bacterium]|jgi:SecD/SecF fusion protein|nr:protein translocase subunit SecD [Desulfobulbaceae bacterium]
MNTSLKLKIGMLLFLVVLSVVTIVPSFYSATPDWWKKYMAPEGLRLGLDLQGGMHLVLKVDLKKAEENSLELAATDLKDGLKEKTITAVRGSSKPGTILFTLPNTGAVETVKTLIKDNFPNIDVQVEAKEGSFPRITLSLKDSEINFIRTHAVDQSLEILRNRIDQFGVAEPVIIRQGADEIVVQLPGVKDPKRAMKLLGDTAQLEFKLVADTAGIKLAEMIEEAKSNGQWAQGEDRKKLTRALQNRLPPDTEIYFEKDKNKQTGQEIIRPLLLENQTLMTGDMVKNAQVRIGGQFNEPYVSIDLTARGGKVFATVTEKNVNRQLAIVLDNVVRSAPSIREKIMGGSAQISGSFSHEEAADLAIILRVGALPAPVDIIQNLTVGASLGQDSINKGLTAGVVGSLMVIVFMMTYYRRAGIIANGAMVLNILFLFAGLAILNATLTLPGIAGIILSIGMAVDSNILIFERMREEYERGKSIRSSVSSGFSEALSTVVDSHMTTLITSLALFLFGTGPIKGFAITLTLGIVFNLFTTLFCSRFVFDILLSHNKLKELHFLQLIKKPNLDYMKLRHITYTISAILVGIGMIASVQMARGKANMGVDFSGGTLLQFKASQAFTMNEVRHAFDQHKLEGLDLQEVENEHSLIVKIKKSEAIVGHLGEQVQSILTTELADKHFTLESRSEIGSSVSSVLRNKAAMAILLSLVGVIIYLAFRFDIRFGVAAAIATLHDIFIILGLCWLLDMEMTLMIVTALLTLGGYSLNDTVIIFDRIRENMAKEKTHTLVTQINDSINQVVGRTIATGLTVCMTLLSLLFLGGSVIHDFAFVLFWGVVIGTFSSAFVASPVLLLWPEKREQ